MHFRLVSFGNNNLSKRKYLKQNTFTYRKKAFYETREIVIKREVTIRHSFHCFLLFRFKVHLTPETILSKLIVHELES